MQTPPFVRLHPQDTVAVAIRPVPAGQPIELATGAVPSNGPTAGDLLTREEIPMGHKVALRELATGSAVHKYGQVIGYAKSPIAAGSWIHLHNLAAGSLQLNYGLATETPAPPTPILGRTFQGYRRPDGRAATRNYIGIVSTVNCSATTSKYVARQFDRDWLAQYPGIDGVVPLVHKSGCAFSYGGADHRHLTRTLSGFAKHPNIAAYIVIGLGCETGQASFLTQEGGLVSLSNLSSNAAGPVVMNIQDVGGVRKTVDRAAGVIRELIPEVQRLQREPIPVSEIVLGLKCGGSDGNSGITANPALGYCSDLLVAHGGTAILSETTEIVGGEHLLTRRAVSEQVARQLLARIDWWINYTALFGEKVDANPSVGNKKGGLTTIYEKSLGAIAKGGGSALQAVYDYSEPVTAKGLVFMDTPGYDPACVTGMVAGGANVVCFTTGRGSVYGCKPTPTIKVSTNTPLYERMLDDMDFNAGIILDGASVADVGTALFEEVIATASGKPTKSEAQDIGDEEFCPWTPGPVT